MKLTIFFPPTFIFVKTTVSVKVSSAEIFFVCSRFYEKVIQNKDVLDLILSSFLSFFFLIWFTESPPNPSNPNNAHGGDGSSTLERRKSPAACFRLPYNPSLLCSTDATVYLWGEFSLFSAHTDLLWKAACQERCSVPNPNHILGDGEGHFSSLVLTGSSCKYIYSAIN